MRLAPLPFALLCLGAALVSSHARADDTPGQLVTFTNGGTNVRNLFTISSNTITINGDEAGFSQWVLGGPVNGRLLGISKLFLVDVSTGQPLPGPSFSTAADAGYVKANAAASFTSRVDWTNDTSNGYFRFTDGGNGSGFSTKDSWLTVGNPTLAGKNGTAQHEFGSFTFTAPSSLLDAKGNFKYDIGIDYLIQSGTDGSTGRAYFNPGSTPVPELSTFVGFGCFVAIGGLAAFRQRKTSKKPA